MRNLPLYVAYILFPLISIIGNLFFENYFRQWLDAVWVLLIIICIPILSIRLFVKTNAITLIAILVFFAILIVNNLLVFEEITSLISYILGIKFAFLLVVASLLAFTFGVPDKRSFVKQGERLALLLLVGYAIEMLMAGELIRPDPTGEVNYEAALLLLTLVVADTKSLSRFQWIVILAAIIFSMSRTALLALIVISFIKFRFGFIKQIIIVFLAVALLIASYLIRGLDLESVEQIDRYWMWLAWIDAVNNATLTQLIIGYGPGVSLPVDVPKQLSWLWENQQDINDLQGVFAYNFHAFWARFSLDYGMLPLSIFLMLCLFPFIALRSRAYMALAAYILMEGLTMGLFYLSSVGVPLMLACMSFLLNRKKSANVE